MGRPNTRRPVEPPVLVVWRSCGALVRRAPDVQRVSSVAPQYGTVSVVDTYPCPACGGVADEPTGAARAAAPMTRSRPRWPGSTRPLAGLDDETRRLAEAPVGPARAPGQQLQAQRTALTRRWPSALADERGDSPLGPARRRPTGTRPDRASRPTAQAPRRAAAADRRDRYRCRSPGGGDLTAVGPEHPAHARRRAARHRRHRGHRARSTARTQTGGRAFILAIATTLALGVPVLLARRTPHRDRRDDRRARPAAGAARRLRRLQRRPGRRRQRLARRCSRPSCSPLVAGGRRGLPPGHPPARAAVRRVCSRSSRCCRWSPSTSALGRDGFAAVVRRGRRAEPRPRSSCSAATRAAAAVPPAGPPGPHRRGRACCASWPGCCSGLRLAASGVLVAVSLVAADTTGEAVRALAGAAAGGGGRASRPASCPAWTPSRQVAVGAAALAVIAAGQPGQRARPARLHPRAHGRGGGRDRPVVDRAAARVPARRPRSAACSARPWPRRRGLERPDHGRGHGPGGHHPGAMGGRPRAVRVPGPHHQWQVPVAAVLLTVLAVAAAPPAWRIDAAVTGGALTLLTLPGTGTVTWWAVPPLAVAGMAAATATALNGGHGDAMRCRGRPRPACSACTRWPPAWPGRSSRR